MDSNTSCSGIQSVEEGDIIHVLEEILSYDNESSSFLWADEHEKSS